MTAALLFVANFTIVFLLGVQQLTVQRGHKLAAFCISPFITGASIVLFKVLPQETTMLDNVVHMLGGSFGIVSGMWMHAYVVALFQPPQRGANHWKPSRPLPPAPTPAPSSHDEHAARLGETLRLATELADDVARSDIESFCVSTELDGVDWFDTHHPDVDFEIGCVAKAVRYLDLRNRLIRQSQQPHLVRFEQ